MTYLVLYQMIICFLDFLLLKLNVYRTHDPRIVEDDLMV